MEPGAGFRAASVSHSSASGLPHRVAVHCHHYTRAPVCIVSAGAKWLGCAIGMASGCLLGLTPLFFYDASASGHGEGSSSSSSSTRTDQTVTVAA